MKLDKYLISTGIAMFLLFFAAILHAQNQRISVDTSILVCQYRVKYYTDTTKLYSQHKQSKNMRYFSNDFVLQIGKKICKYYNQTTDEYEEIFANEKTRLAYSQQLQLAMDKQKQTGEKLNLKFLSRESPLVIYTYILEGRRLVQDAAFLDYYVYEEDNSPQAWVIVSDSTKEVLGYTCQKGRCSYRGRDYEAWFTPEVAVNAGPWKFLGLPGLILEVKDTKWHYTFHIIGIEKKEEPIEYVEYTRYKFTQADRKTVLRAKAKAANIGWERYMKASTNQNASNNDQHKSMSNNKSRYNLLERDYYKR